MQLTLPTITAALAHVCNHRAWDHCATSGSEGTGGRQCFIYCQYKACKHGYSCVQSQGLGPLRYQWFRGDRRLTVATADSATLVIVEVSIADAGTYVCEVGSGDNMCDVSVLRLTVATADSPTLVIVEVSIADAGTYVCEVSAGDTCKRVCCFI